MCSELEKNHPHIIKRLNLLWNSELLDGYLNGLILSDLFRSDRIEFSEAVISELMVIQRVHNQLFGGIS